MGLKVKYWEALTCHACILRARAGSLAAGRLLACFAARSHRPDLPSDFRER